MAGHRLATTTPVFDVAVPELERGTIAGGEPDSGRRVGTPNPSQNRRSAGTPRSVTGADRLSLRGVSPSGGEIATVDAVPRADAVREPDRTLHRQASDQVRTTSDSSCDGRTTRDPDTNPRAGTCVPSSGPPHSQTVTSR